MAKKRYTHKQIRKSIKHDELRDLLGRLYDFVRKNTENILITVIIFVVILILIPLYFNNRRQNEQRAYSLLNRAISYSMQPVAEGLVDPSSGAFRTLDEKYKKVQQLFAEVSATYRNTHAALLAKVGEANASFYLKEYKEAIALYREAKLKQTDLHMKSTFDERIGACLENLGKWQEALNAYQSILKENPNYFNQRAVRISMARCLMNLGQSAQAKDILKAEQEKEPGSYWSEVARRRLLLQAQGQK